ncbi:MAG: DUF1116 domain-containing protein [Candidatus Hodarchaeaceae archaeon]|nr:DUF1116 domain-containing protein [Candidatus Hodarchaeaceae archaeon]
MKLLGEKLRVVNVGVRLFYECVKAQGAEAIHVEWRPPAGGDEKLARLLEKLDRPEIDEANKKAVEKILAATPTLIDIKTAKDVIPGMTEHTILHSGPPIEYERMSGPTKGAIWGALIYEGLAKDQREADKLVASGKIKFAPCHDHDSVGPMAGIISPSMPVFVVENKEHGNRAYSNLNEGLGKVLRYGAYEASVIKRLKWMEKTLAPVLKDALKRSGPIDLKAIMAQALHMGDELHCRNVASSLIFLKLMAPHIAATGFGKKALGEVMKFMGENFLFFLNPAMAACKATQDAGHGIEHSTVVTTLSRNGTDFGIKVSGLGKQWFTAPAEIPKTLFFPGFTEADANPDIGDSAIMETAGFGGFASAAAPAVVQVVGGSPSVAADYTREMGEICLVKDGSLSIPFMNFEGIPRCIDMRKVIDTGILPFINTGVAHRKPGFGTVGFGVLRAPMLCFTKALKAMADKY